MDLTTPTRPRISSLSKRACEQCSKKKTKCDRQMPICGLCRRIDSPCYFPTARKQRHRRNHLGSASSSNPPTSGVEGEQPHDSGHADPVGPGLIGAHHFTTPDTPTPSLEVPVDFEALGGSMQYGDIAQLTVYECSSVSRQSAIDAGRLADTPDEVRVTDTHFSSQLSLDDQLSLVDVFFRKVHGWLSMLHRPRFYSRYISPAASRGDRLDLNALPLEEQLIFLCIFALASRFSSLPMFGDIAPHDRDNSLIEEATGISENLRSSIDRPNLQLLQGNVLLAFCYVVSGQIARGSSAAGLCVHLAYDLDLNTTDEDDQEDSSSQIGQWVDKEELRRVWWLVWELDTFCSVLSARPYTIDKRRILVNLPCSETAWWANTPTKAIKLSNQPMEIWKCLVGIPNLDERLWYLVSKYLSSFSHDLAHVPTDVSSRELPDLQMAMQLFKMALPESFNLEMNASQFKSETATRANFVIATHLILTTTSWTISNIASKNASLKGAGPRNSTFHLDAHAAEMTRVISHWNPDFVPFMHPFVSATFMPIHAGPSQLLTSGFGVATSDTLRNGQEIVILALSRVATVWKLGITFQKLIRTIKHREQFVARNNFELERYFRLFFKVRQNGSRHYASVHTERSSASSAACIQTSGAPGEHGHATSNDQVASEDDDTTHLSLEINDTMSAVGLDLDALLDVFPADSVFDLQNL